MEEIPILGNILAIFFLMPLCAGAWEFVKETWDDSLGAVLIFFPAAFSVFLILLFMILVNVFAVIHKICGC